LNALPFGEAQFAWRAVSGVAGARAAADEFAEAIAVGTDIDERKKSKLREIGMSDLSVDIFVIIFSTDSYLCYLDVLPPGTSK
jgi:hypothetical protein